MKIFTDQNLVEVCGEAAQFAATPDGYFGGSGCEGCFFEAMPQLCRQAPCMGSERTDSKNGFFSSKKV
jgi:hypothetical protein